MGTLYVVGIGPGSERDMTHRARAVLEAADLLCGYDGYLDLIRPRFPGKACLGTGMRREAERCRSALDAAVSGKTVALVCGGDPGVYGMAGLLIELAGERPPVDIEIVPGVSAAMAGAALLGAPLANDFAVVSLSDLLTPWETIAARLRAAAAADFVICLYNPASRRRVDHLRRACDIVLETRSRDTVCGWARNAGREGESFGVTSLAALGGQTVDMFTTVFIGSGATRNIGGRMATPRGYRGAGL